MTVTWTTWAPARSEVQFGIQLSGPLPFRAHGAASTFVDGGILRRKLYMHRVTLRKLVPGVQYGERDGGGQGEVCSRSYPAPPPDVGDPGIRD